jgi:CspA family cold shock protein
MAKTDNWQRRRRSEKGFDEFASFPDPLPTPPSYPRRPIPSAAPISNGPESTAIVKWFNAEKGFGFVEMTEGTGDVFLHASVLARTGVTAVSPAPAPRGPRPAGGGYGTPAGLSGGQRRSFDSPGPSGPEQQGTVKWYNTSKGFGFIAPEDGGKDVFVHASALRRAGLTELAEGQRVTIQVTQGQKGPEAASIRIS